MEEYRIMEEGPWPSSSLKQRGGSMSLYKAIDIAKHLSWYHQVNYRVRDEHGHNMFNVGYKRYMPGEVNYLVYSREVTSPGQWHLLEGYHSTLRRAVAAALYLNGLSRRGKLSDGSVGPIAYRVRVTSPQDTAPDEIEWDFDPQEADWDFMESQ